MHSPLRWWRRRSPGRTTRVVLRTSAAVFVGAVTVAGCGAQRQVAPSAASPDLECDGAASGLFEADLDPSSPGDATAAAALDRQLRTFVDQYGSGEIVTLRDGVGAVVIEGRRVLVLETHPAPAGGFWADTVHFCQPYVDMLQGPSTPATEPLATLPPADATAATIGEVETVVESLDDVPPETAASASDIAPPDLGVVADETTLVAAVLASGPLDNLTDTAADQGRVVPASICVDAMVRRADGEAIHEALASFAGEVGVVLVVERPDGTREVRMYGVGSEDPVTGGCPLLLRADL